MFKFDKKTEYQCSVLLSQFVVRTCKQNIKTQIKSIHIYSLKVKFCHSANLWCLCSQMTI